MEAVGEMTDVVNTSLWSADFIQRHGKKIVKELRMYTRMRRMKFGASFKVFLRSRHHFLETFMNVYDNSGCTKNWLGLRHNKTADLKHVTQGAGYVMSPNWPIFECYKTADLGSIILFIPSLP